MESIVDIYKKGHEILAEAIKNLSEKELTYKPSENAWSVREIVCHIADGEMTGIQRMKRILSENNPLITTYDQDAFARSLHYNQLDEKQSLALFKMLRESFLPTLEALTEQDWERTGIHAEYGEITLRELFEIYADHIPKHVGQIDRNLRQLKERGF